MGDDEVKVRHLVVIAVVSYEASSNPGGCLVDFVKNGAYWLVAPPGSVAVDVWGELNASVTLTENNRAESGDKLGGVLARMREGAATEEDLAAVRSRKVCSSNLVPAGARFLHRTNKDAVCQATAMAHAYAKVLGKRVIRLDALMTKEGEEWRPRAARPGQEPIVEKELSLWKRGARGAATVKGQPHARLDVYIGMRLNYYLNN